MSQCILGENGEITIPADILQALNLSAGDVFRIEFVNEQLILIPQNSTVKMNISENNAKNIASLISHNLFQTEREVLDYSLEYAFNVDSDAYVEEVLELNTETLNILNDMSKKTGVSMNFLLNRILKRYLDSEKEKVEFGEESVE